MSTLCQNDAVTAEGLRAFSGLLTEKLTSGSVYASELARVVGVHRSAINNWRYQRRAPSLAHARKVAAVLGVEDRIVRTWFPEIFGAPRVGAHGAETVQSRVKGEGRGADEPRRSVPPRKELLAVFSSSAYQRCCGAILSQLGEDETTVEALAIDLPRLIEDWKARRNQSSGRRAVGRRR